MNATTSAVQQYRQNHIQGGVDSASPHRLVQMLIEGALERVLSAKGFMQNKDVARKGEQIGKAISIIDGLRSCLDMEAGGEISGNLFELYSYMERRLLEANLKNDLSALDEVIQLMIQVKLGWDVIPSEHHFKKS